MQDFKLAKIAWRNLWRNRRRTLITASSIAFGLFLAIVFTGIGDSNWSKMIDFAARIGGGHITLQHPEYLDAPSFSRYISKIPTLKKNATAQEGVLRAVERITGQVMLGSAEDTLGAALIGIDAGSEDITTLSILEGLETGELFSAKDAREIILGAKLAENLGLEHGDKLVYTTTDKSGDIVADMARVKGLIRTGSPSIDAGLAIMPIDTVRKTLGYSADEATLLAIFVENQGEVNSIAEKVAKLDNAGAATLTWDRASPELAGFISMKVGGAIFFELIMMILIAAGIFNTLFVSVMERMREFGIMMAIGFSPFQLFRLVIWESFWLALVGMFAGAIITLWPYHYMYNTGIDLSAKVGAGVEVAGVAIDPIMRIDITGPHLLIIIVAILIATLLSGLYPALRAGKVAPVESIRLV